MIEKLNNYPIYKIYFFLLKFEVSYIDNDPSGTTLDSGTSVSDLIWGATYRVGIGYKF